MSHRLDFLAAGPPPTLEAFSAHFLDRPNYVLTDTQALYQNEDTGVYFAFDLPEEEAGSAAPGGAWASFTINYLRPGFFAEEAAAEIEAFLAAFPGEVDDPQAGGLGRGAFGREGFVRGWSAGNRAAHAGLLQRREGELVTLPRAQLDTIWRWNASRRRRAAGLRDAAFVPRIMFVRAPAGPRSFTVWTDASPVVLPATDVVVLARETLAPRRWLRRKADVALVEWAEVAPVVSPFRREADPLPHWHLEWAEPPAPAVELFRRATPLAAPLRGIPAGELLETELVEAARAARGQGP